MTGDQIFQLFAYLLPSVITGAIAFYFFRMHTNNEEGRRRFLLHKDSQASTLPIRLQAYERMALFLERISEFEHNLSQQIYLTDELWNVIKAAKTATIQMIRKAGMSETDSADKLREDVLTETMDKQNPSATALAFVKKEISELW